MGLLEKWSFGTQVSEYKTNVDASNQPNTVFSVMYMMLNHRCSNNLLSHIPKLSDDMYA